MTAVEKYQQLVDAGLIIPATITPPGFKFPTMLVYMPSVATNGAIDRELIDKVNAGLERRSKGNQ